MQTQIKKIIIGAAALIFLFSGVSYAKDRDRRHHKPQGKAHGYYKAKKNPHHRDQRQLERKKHYRQEHTYKKVHHRPYYNRGHRPYYGKHNRHWEKSRARYSRYHHDRYRHRKVHHHHRSDYHRRAPREDLFYKAVFKDPGIIFKIILNER